MKLILYSENNIYSLENTGHTSEILFILILFLGIYSLSCVLLIHSHGFPPMLGDIWLSTHLSTDISSLTCCVYHTTCLKKPVGMLGLGDT